MSVRVSGLLVVILVAVGIAFYSACSGSDEESRQADKKGKNKDKDKNKQKQGSGTPFNGGTFEASGVAFVPGGEGVLFVDDSRPGEVFWMKIDQAGQQVGDIKPIKLETVVENPEGITFDGSYFYVVGSQSNPKGGAQNSIARFAFDHTTQRADKTATIGNLREWLLTKVSDLKDFAQVKGRQGGLNIEGVAWDPEGKRLLLGLRSPIVNGQALIVPIKLVDPNGPFSPENLEVDGGRAIPVSVGGSGIRDIQYDNELKSFLLISGAPENEEKGDFILWNWNGGTGSSQPVQKKVLDQRVKPEGITAVEIGGNRFVFIVCDASRYTMIDYTELK